MRTLRRFSAFIWLLILFAGISLGQTAEVTHNVNLRSDPSTANLPIRLLTPPEQVELLETAKTSRTTTPKGPARLAVDTMGQEG